MSPASPFRPGQPLVRVLRFAAFAAEVDLRASVQRTGLGPLWSTVGLALVIAVLGLFFGTVFRQQLPDYDIYIPYLTAGLITWNFMAASIHQGCTQIWNFLTSRRYAAIPLSAEIGRVMIRQTFVLAVNLAVGLLAWTLYSDRLATDVPTLMAGLMLLLINVAWICYIAALICARFRDMLQLVAWAVHLAFFLTPILWMDYNLGRYDYLVHLNPFAHLVAVVRQPLLGLAVPTESWIAVLVLGLAGVIVSLWLSRRLGPRLAYWL
jgi:lipopolysaccharide transport system permease protein